MKLKSSSCPSTDSIFVLPLVDGELGTYGWKVCNFRVVEDRSGIAGRERQLLHAHVHAARARSSDEFRLNQVGPLSSCAG
jgi:hypothetical protein